MSRPLRVAPGVAPVSASEVTRCPMLAAAHATSQRLRIRFGAASHAPAMLRSNRWQPAGGPSEMIDEPRPRAARPPIFPAAAGFQ
jgi:hypothetical protein